MIKSLSSSDNYLASLNYLGQNYILVFSMERSSDQMHFSPEEK